MSQKCLMTLLNLNIDQKMLKYLKVHDFVKPGNKKTFRCLSKIKFSGDVYE